jgi:hypothetical protein
MPQDTAKRTNQQQLPVRRGVKNDKLFRELLTSIIPQASLFQKSEFHGNVKWCPEEVVIPSLVWSWQEATNVTDAFQQSLEICENLKLKGMIGTCTGFMDALTCYRELFHNRLRDRLQTLAEEVVGEQFRTDGWLLIGFDGSRISAPRTRSNEQALCAPNYGKGREAKYGKKKCKGMRRKRNKANPPAPPKPQAWVTMMFDMSFRIPLRWRLGPSNASERDHVKEMIIEKTFPEKTLFCGDAGFVGYPLWSTILNAGQNFLVRVGANVELLSEHADIKACGGGKVLCWPKGQMKSGEPPLTLWLVKVIVGKTAMWMLTSVRKLSREQIVRYYKMRWGIEVEFRGLKQTLDKHMLRCRNSERLLVELDWSIFAMALAELIALRQQICNSSERVKSAGYDPKDRSLANTMRALRKCMRQLHKCPDPDDHLLHRLSRAVVQRYKNRTNKQARYRPKNPDKKPLGDPNVRPLSTEQLRKLQQMQQSGAK